MTWFIRAWVALFLLLNVLAIIGMISAAPTLRAGMEAIQDNFDPLNVWNWLVEIFVLLPVFGAMFWRASRRERAGNRG